MKENYQIKELFLRVKLKSLELFFDKDLNWLFKNEDLLLDLKSIKSIFRINYFLKNNLDYTFLINYKYIYGLKFFLNKNVFVPQFDTEVMIEKIIKLIKKEHLNEILEIGSGSGIIPIVLSKQFPKIKINSFDINLEAINLSNQNNILNKTSVIFFQQDLFKFSSNKKYDLIVSNPPYISENDSNVSSWVKQNQPFEALYSPQEGLLHIKKLLSLIETNLKKGGYLIFEFGWMQKKSIEKLIKNNKLIMLYNFYKDFNNNWRFITIKKKD